MRAPPSASERRRARACGTLLASACALLAAASGCRLFIDTDGITGDALAADDGSAESGPGPNGDAGSGAPASDAEPDRGTGKDGSGDGSGADAGDAGPAVSLQGCVLLLHFDESSWSGPSAVVDSSGRGNHGTTVNTMSTTPSGKFGRAAQFDGTGWIDIGDSASLHATDALTYVAWIYPTSLSDGVASPGILAKRDGPGNQVAFTMFLWTGNHLWVDLGAARDTTPALFLNDQWYHVAVVFDGAAAPAQRLRAYVNGALDGTFAADATLSANTSHLLVGNLNNGGDKFVGRIDEVAIWARALSDAEIKRLYLAASPL